MKEVFQVGNLQEVLQEIAKEYKAAPQRPFPYEDLRRVKADFASEFTRLGPGHSINADLNDYFAFIAGLASGGLQRHLDDPLAKAKVRSLLRKPFFGRFSEYRFMQRVDLSKYPSLEAELSLSERLRKLLVKALEESHQAPATKAGWKKVGPNLTTLSSSGASRREKK